MVDYLRKLFDTSKRDVESLAPIVDRINSYEEDFAAKSDEELQELTLKFKERLNAGETLEDVLPEAFAAVREASKRTLKMRHFDVQLLAVYNKVYASAWSTSVMRPISISGSQVQAPTTGTPR